MGGVSSGAMLASVTSIHPCGPIQPSLPARLAQSVVKFPSAFRVCIVPTPRGSGAHQKGSPAHSWLGKFRGLSASGYTVVKVGATGA